MNSTKAKTTKEIIHFPILKRRDSYPKRNEYKEYREEIREDCKKRCVYCDTHENELGGPEIKSLTIDHLRPKHHFRSLINEPTNLVFACTSCNTLKGDYWPALGQGDLLVFKSEGYIDPFADNRVKYLSVDRDGKLVPLKAPATFLINRLSLNRESLVLIRLQRNLANEVFNRVQDLLDYHERERMTLEDLIAGKGDPLTTGQDRLFKREVIVHKQLEATIKQMLRFLEIYITRLD